MFGWYWYPTRDGDPRAYALMARHYSFQPYCDGRRQNLFYRNRRLFVGPGEKMVLLTASCDALLVWRKFRDDSGQVGVNCAVFRNEGPIQSSLLILEAEQLACGHRLYTYINVEKVRTGRPKTGRPNPGKCYLKAGWRTCGHTKKGLLILEKCPPLYRMV